MTRPTKAPPSSTARPFRASVAVSPDGSVLWWHSSDNPSPRITQKFLDRQRRLLLPGQYAREHGNVWVDAADSFTTSPR